jgi:protease I
MTSQLQGRRVASLVANEGDRTLTSWPSLRTDLTNAGAEWIDTPVHVDTNGPNALVSSRKPDDLPAFTAQLVETFATAPAPA